MGDSAGGNLAAVCSLMARDRNGPKIKYQALINPMVDLTNPGVYKEYCSCYLRSIEDAKSAYTSPVFADLKNLPTTFLVINEEDCLYEQNINFDSLLKNANVEIYSKVFPGWHLGHHFADMDQRAEEPINWLLKQMASC